MLAPCGVVFAGARGGGKLTLKEYYEIVGESRPLSVFFPTHADLFTEMHFYQ